MQLKRSMAVFCSAALVAVAMTGCGQSTESVELASFAQGSVSEAALNEQMAKSVGMQVMMDLVDRGILDTIEPVTEEMTATVDQNLENIKAYYQDDFETSLKVNGFETEDDFKATMLLEEQRLAYTLKYIASTVLTEEDVQAYYDNYEPEIQASHILVDDEALAKEIIEKINAGEDFAALAAEFSTDPGSGANGGDLGSFGKGMMVPEFETAAFALAIDEVTQEPVQSQFGYHIIKKTGGEAKGDFESMKAEIEKSMAEQSLQADQNLMHKALVQLRADNGLEIKNSVIDAQYKLFAEQVAQ